MTRDTAELYRGLRGRLFSTKAESLGITADEGEKVWGVIADMGLDSAVASLVVLRDGTISLYFSNGGGLIGLGLHDALHEKAAAVLRIADELAPEGDEAERFTLPPEGRTRFNFLTFKGACAYEEDDEELDAGEHALSPLYQAVHELVAAAEDVDEKRLKGAGENA